MNLDAILGGYDRLFKAVGVGCLASTAPLVVQFTTIDSVDRRNSNDP